MYPFVQAAGYHAGRNAPKRILIVMHAMEVPEGANTAESVANFFAHNSGASAHFCVDQDSIVQCVGLGDTAWHAPNANNDGVGIEMGGYSSRSRQDWLNDVEMLNRAASVAAEVCHTLKLFPGIEIPRRRLSLDEIRGGVQSGFCGHVDVTNAFNTYGGHTDPGNNFPWDVFLPKVEFIMGLINGNPNFHPSFR